MGKDIRDEEIPGATPDIEPGRRSHAADSPMADQTAARVPARSSPSRG
jgi:hypothetical protein